jgi:ribosome-associated protein
MCDMDSITFALRGDYITLDALLKVTGSAPSGGVAKMMIAQGEVQVDAQVELRKTCKIRVGQRIEVGDTQITVVADAA